MRQYGFHLALLLVIGALAAWVSHQNSANAHQGSQAHKSLCVFREDLISRFHTGEKFLLHHPRGIPGISASLMRNSLLNQERTVEALDASGLTCN